MEFRRRRLLGGRYELLEPLASGGMGRVWRGRDTLLQRPVAVKVLRNEYTGDATFRARFRAEAQHTAVLSHPNIAAVHDYGEAEVDGEQQAYLVMELIEGEPLSALLAREGRLDVGRTLGIVRQTAAALGAAHAAGVVHRDVKPGNVLVAPDGQVKITDFGIASSASSVPLTGTGQVLGTAHYLAPEQAQGGKATPASDVYALGAVAYECLTGRRPIDGENSVQIALKQIREDPPPLPSEIPPAVRRLVERAMAKDPARRFPDGAALRDAVDALEAGPAAEHPTAVIGRVHTTAPLGPPPPLGARPSARGPRTAVMPGPPVGAAPASPSSPPPRAGRRALVALLSGALAVVALVAIGVAVLPTGDSGSPSSPTSPTSQATSEPVPQTVTLVADDYVGRPIAEVQAELAGAGLQVQPTPVETADAGNGVVTGVSPVGELPLGSTVTVSYAVRPPKKDGPGPDDGPGRGPGDRPGRGHGHDD